MEILQITNRYFIESYVGNTIHLYFSSSYHKKYTQSTFLYQLVWLLINQDLRSVFENVAYEFNRTGILNFQWLFKQSITIKAVVKLSANGGTVLRVTSVKNKIIPCDEVTFEHPEVGKSEKSNEPKKYTLYSKKKLKEEQDELVLDEAIEGTTDDFDIIEMDNQKHEYIKLPKIKKVRKNSNKKRELEDENTKKRFVNDEGKRSTADVGGNQVTRGLEQQSLTDVRVDGELSEFIKVMKILQDFREVQSIEILQGSLKEFSRIKRFVYLNDGVTERRYVIAEIKLFSGKEVSLIEVEREYKAVSTLICFDITNKRFIYEEILAGIISSSGNWDKRQLQLRGIRCATLKHGKKDQSHRANVLNDKFI